MMILIMLALCEISGGATARDAELGPHVDQRADGVIILRTDEPMPERAWQYKATRWGMYFVEVAYTARDEAKVTVDIAGTPVTAVLQPMDDAADQPFVRLGRVYVAKAGPTTFSIKTQGPAEVRGVKLVPAPEGPEGERIEQAADGSILLHGRDATVHGTMLRYEPKPEKNTLGYWVNEGDYATWDFHVSGAGAGGGRFTVEILQGCGTGQGGSEAAVIVGDQTLTFTVEDTGHFQNFVPRNVGVIELPTGANTLKLTPVKRAAKAVMDVRQVRLIPVR